MAPISCETPQLIIPEFILSSQASPNLGSPCSGVYERGQWQISISIEIDALPTKWKTLWQLQLRREMEPWMVEYQMGVKGLGLIVLCGIWDRDAKLSLQKEYKVRQDPDVGVIRWGLMVSVTSWLYIFVHFCKPDLSQMCSIDNLHWVSTCFTQIEYLCTFLMAISQISSGVSFPSSASQSSLIEFKEMRRRRRMWEYHPL